MAAHTCPTLPCPICAEPLLRDLRGALEAAEKRALDAEAVVATYRESARLGEIEREETTTTITELKSQIADARSPCCNAAVRCGRCGGDTRYAV